MADTKRLRLGGLIILIITLLQVTQIVKAQTPPEIPKSFAATIQQISNTNGLVSNYYAELFYSVTQKGKIYQGIDYVLELQYNLTMHASGNESYETVNNQCRAQGAPFVDIYAWLPYSTYGGQYEINNQMTEMWYINTTDVYIAMYTVGNKPIQQISMEEIPQVGNLSYVTNFLQFTETTFPDSFFDIPETCLGNGLFCPAGGIADIQVYMFHTTTDYSLTNNNAADLLGDANFICTYGTSGPNGYQLISTYSVQVNTTWGQYALCNFGTCVGLNLVTVGREAIEGITYNGGQCSVNTDIGNWYSFPEAGACPNNGPVTEGCYWGNVKVLKTISMECLQDLGFWDKYCATENEPDDDEAAIVLNQAFVLDDPALGGCPPITNTSSPLSFPSSSSTSSSSLKESSSGVSKPYRRLGRTERYQRLERIAKTLLLEKETKE